MRRGDLERPLRRLAAQAVRDREREGLIHRPGADRCVGQTADPQQHLAEILDPLPAGLAAPEMITRPFEILAIQSIVEDRTGRDPGAAIAVKI